MGHSMPKTFLERKVEMVRENIYRTVTCGELRESNIGDTVRVAGWVENIRDHGGVMFLDIRDHYGVLQVVVHNDEILKDIRQLQNDGAKYDWELKQLQWLHPELKVQPPEANPHPFKSTDLNLDMNPGKVPDVTKQNQ